MTALLHVEFAPVGQLRPRPVVADRVDGQARQRVALGERTTSLLQYFRPSRDSLAQPLEYLPLQLVASLLQPEDLTLSLL